MQTHVNVGWSQEFKLTKALLMYGESNYNCYPYRNPFVTVHDVIHEDGQARLASGELVTPGMLRELVAKFQESPAIEILPAQVLVRTKDLLVWWAPAGVRTMFFKGGIDDAKVLRELNGKRYPHPPVVFKAHGNALSIRALKDNRRPTPETVLCMAPYWNCYDNGSICTGTMRIPQERSVRATAEWEESFYNSAFTHPAGTRKHTTHPEGLAVMWKEIRGKNRFPSRYLVPTDETLEEFVISNDTGYRNRIRQRA
jgi:PRTRC genetic system protein B